MSYSALWNPHTELTMSSAYCAPYLNHEFGCRSTAWTSRLPTTPPPSSCTLSPSLWACPSPSCWPTQPTLSSKVRDTLVSTLCFLCAQTVRKLNLHLQTRLLHKLHTGQAGLGALAITQYYCASIAEDACAVLYGATPTEGLMTQKSLLVQTFVCQCDSVASPCSHEAEARSVAT